LDLYSGYLNFRVMFEPVKNQISLRKDRVGYSTAVVSELGMLFNDVQDH